MTFAAARKLLLAADLRSLIEVAWRRLGPKRLMAASEGDR